MITPNATDLLKRPPKKKTRCARLKRKRQADISLSSQSKFLWAQHVNMQSQLRILTLLLAWLICQSNVYATPLPTSNSTIGSAALSTIRPICWKSIEQPHLQRVTLQSCRPSLDKLDRDMSRSPEPQIWGGRKGIREEIWRDSDATLCQIEFFLSELPSLVEPQSFTYDYVKRTAISILRSCSRVLGPEGLGGYVEIAPRMIVQVAADPGLVRVDNITSYAAEVLSR